MFKLKSLALFAALAVFVFGAASQVRAQDDDEAGGYVKARVDNPDVKAAAAFAVREKARLSGAAISLSSIKSAQMQVVAGVNFELCLEVAARDRGQAEASEMFVKTVVYRNLQNVFKLTSWLVEDCDPGDE